MTRRNDQQIDSIDSNKRSDESVRDVHLQVDPGPILQTGFAFWSSKVLLTAVDFGLFTKLGDRHLSGAELGAELGLHPRGISDFFDWIEAMLHGEPIRCARTLD